MRILVTSYRPNSLNPPRSSLLETFIAEDENPQKVIETVATHIAGLDANNPPVNYRFRHTIYELSSNHGEWFLETKREIFELADEKKSKQLG